MLNYVVVPSWVYAKMSDRPLASNVLMCLMFNRNTRTNRTNFMPKSQIACESGVSRSSVCRLLAWLECSGLIETIAVRRGEYMYYISCLGDLDETGTVDELSYEQRMAVLWKEFEDA